MKILSPLYLMFGVLGMIVLTYTSAIAQDQEDNSLEGQYDRMIENSESYDNFKVIPRTRLRSMWNTIEDSLQMYKSSVNELSSGMDSLNQEMAAMEEELKTTRASLEDSRTLENRIRLLGIVFQKDTYNIVLWSLVSVLGVIIFGQYISFRKSHRITQETRKDNRELKEELENNRKKATEKQIKLKRELQTALNELEEMKRHR